MFIDRTIAGARTVIRRAIPTRLKLVSTVAMIARKEMKCLFFVPFPAQRSRICPGGPPP